MMEEAKDEIKILMSGYPLAQIVSAGASPVAFKKIKQSQVQIRALAQISKEDFKMFSQYLAKFSQLGAENRVQARHLADSNFQCRFTITDRKETVLYLTIRPLPKPTIQKETAMWTNSKAVATVFNAFFEKLWVESIDAREKLKEITSK